MSVFKSFTFKVANMKKTQSFVIYPYDGSDTCILQSDGRFCRLNLRNGKGIINHKNENYANSIKLALNPLPFDMPEDVLAEIKAYLWTNSGTQRDKSLGLIIQNEELYSNKQ